ncbi:hypothetical protein GOA90_25090 [Sinorhizobium meliloti]|nr:hypothetical protein [Sinorhizobium meliloti]
MHKIVTALAGIRRQFIGGFDTRKFREGRSKYMPHIGAKQRAKYAALPDGFMDAASRARGA